MDKKARDRSPLRHAVALLLVLSATAGVLLVAASPAGAEESDAGCGVDAYEPWYTHPSEPWADVALVGWAGTYGCNGARYCADVFFIAEYSFGSRVAVRELHWCGTANYGAALGANCYDSYPDMNRYEMLIHADGQTVFSAAVSDYLTCVA